MEGERGVKPAAAQTIRSVATLLAVATALLWACVAPALADSGLAPDPAPSAGHGSGLAPDGAPSAGEQPALPAPSQHESPAPVQASPPAQPAAVPSPTRRAVRAHRHRPAHPAGHARRLRTAGPPSVSTAYRPFLPDVRSAGGGGLDGPWLLVAASTLLLVVFLGGSLFALAAGQARSTRS
jgi:hypothetical protein